VENFNIFKQRILSHDAAIVQPHSPRMKAVCVVRTRSVRRTSGFVQVGLSDKLNLKDEAVA
jgi:hypothetical protein